MRKNFNAISLFSGAGGFDLGVHRAGCVRTLACYELNDVFVQTLRLNGEKLRLASDLPPPDIYEKDLADDSVISEMASLYRDVDIIFGGPPCQSFSIMGKKGGTEDPRGALIFSFQKIISTLNPKCFLFENVPNFAAIESGEIANSLTESFARLGYSLWSGVLCAADYGAYTFRRRFFIIGVKGIPRVSSPQPSHFEIQDCLSGVGPNSWKKCRDVFKEVEVWETGQKILLNHGKTKHSQKVTERFAALKFGETDHIRKRNRLNPERPAHSIYVGGVTGKLQARTHIHPFLPRELTARECAAIQGFPLDWVFSGKPDAVLLQAANAVPVQLAQSLGVHLVSLLRQSESGALSGLTKSLVATAT